MNSFQAFTRICCIYFVVLSCLAYAEQSGNSTSAIRCRAPGTMEFGRNNHKFLIFGCDHCNGAGVGNSLIFFPAAYHFAVISGREIILPDNSNAGQVCKTIRCGTPLLSEMVHAFPDILSKEKIAAAKQYKVFQFMEFIRGETKIDEPVIYVDGFVAYRSDWYHAHPNGLECINRITGCYPGDTNCADRHALQALIQGPFISSLTAKEEERVRGVPDHFKHAILNLPHAYSPRIDIAIHMRNQFTHFENQASINSTGYVTEVQTWLNSSDCQTVFKLMGERLEAEMADSRAIASRAADEPLYVYVACDNEDVKDALVYYLEPRPWPMGASRSVRSRVPESFVALCTKVLIMPPPILHDNTLLAKDNEYQSNTISMTPS